VTNHTNPSWREDGWELGQPRSACETIAKLKTTYLSLDGIALGFRSQGLDNPQFKAFRQSLLPRRRRVDSSEPPGHSS